MKFFVTGVGGQLGHDVMNELLKRGMRVLVLIFRRFTVVLQTDLQLQERLMYL